MKRSTLEIISGILIGMAGFVAIKHFQSGVSPIPLETRLAILIPLISAWTIWFYIYLRGEKEERDEQTRPTKTSS